MRFNALCRPAPSFPCSFTWTQAQQPTGCRELLASASVCACQPPHPDESGRWLHYHRRRQGGAQPFAYHSGSHRSCKRSLRACPAERSHHPDRTPGPSPVANANTTLRTFTGTAGISPKLLAMSLPKTERRRLSSRVSRARVVTKDRLSTPSLGKTWAWDAIVASESVAHGIS